MLCKVTMKISSLITAVRLFYSASAQLSKLASGNLDPDFTVSQRLQHAPKHNVWSQTPMVVGNESHWRKVAHDATPGTAGWHPRRVELHDLVPVKSIQAHRLEVVHHPELVMTPVLAKLAASPKDLASLAREDTIYRLLYDLNVTPLFLGHVTVDGLIVGFLTEYVQSKGSDDTLGPSPPGKTEACLAALRSMHAKGIAHGDAHGENCLARGDGSAVLIDFELALETSAQAELDRDLWIMAHTAGS